MAKKIVLWRHGQTDYNVQGIVQGHLGVDLNETGQQQAATAAKLLAEMEPEKIICSVLERAVSTAQCLSDLTGVPVTQDERLVERSFGEFEGLKERELQLRFPEEFKIWRETGEAEGAGLESRATVGARMAEAVNEWADKVEGTLVVVSHGSALTQGIVALLGLEPHSWQGIRGLDNCHWTVLIPSKRQPKWRLVSHNVGA